MKIVYYTQPIFLDSDLPLLQEYQRQGHDVLVFITLAPYSLRGMVFDIKEQIKRDDIVNVSEYKEIAFGGYLDLENVYFVNRTTSSVKTLAYYRTMRKMCKMIKQFKPDVIHTTMPLDTMDLMMLQFKSKLVLTVHDPFLHSGQGNFRSRIFRNMSFKLIPKMVLLNLSQKEQFKHVYGVKEEQVLVNRLGVYNYISSLKTECAKDENFNFLFFGRIDSYKGLEFLCEAMVEVHKSHHNATLTIAGGGKIYFDFSPYEKLDYIEVRNRYIPIEELAYLLERCTVAVCPYKDATQSGVVMTAFAKECPLIASNVGGLCEQIEDNRTGILVPPCDSKALAQAMIAMLDRPSLAERMVSNIRIRNIENCNTWKSIAKNYITFYSKHI